MSKPARRHFSRKTRVGLIALSLVAVVVGAAGENAAPAVASSLCSTLSCGLDAYPANTPLAASLEEGTEFKLLTSIGTAACKSSTLAGETTAQEGNPLPLKITELAFGTCKLGGTACTVTTGTLPTSSSLKATGEGDGTLILEGLTVTVKCGFLINCTYEEVFGPEKMPSLQLEGGNPAAFGVEEHTLSRLGGFCPEVAKLDASYTLTEPTPAFAVET